MSNQSFNLGRTVITASAMSALTENGIDAIPFLARHAVCDFGDVCVEDKEQNILEIETFCEIGVGRVMSIYTAKEITFWIITDMSQSGNITTILMPSDY